MKLPTGFLKVCSCGLIVAKTDLREPKLCSCGLVWDGFHKHETRPVEPEHPTLDESVDD
jgi:hypothetical protein